MWGPAILPVIYRKQESPLASSGSSASSASAASAASSGALPITHHRSPEPLRLQRSTDVPITRPNPSSIPSSPCFIDTFQHYLIIPSLMPIKYWNYPTLQIRFFSFYFIYSFFFVVIASSNPFVNCIRFPIIKLFVHLNVSWVESHWIGARKWARYRPIEWFKQVDYSNRNCANTETADSAHLCYAPQRCL